MKQSIANFSPVVSRAHRAVKQPKPSPLSAIERGLRRQLNDALDRFEELSSGALPEPTAAGHQRYLDVERELDQLDTFIRTTREIIHTHNGVTAHITEV